MSLRDEILEQPAVLARLLESGVETAREIAGRIRSADVRWVSIAARGSSDHAALYAKYLWGAHHALPVALAAPSLYTLYRSPPRLEGALVVGISQSGQSPDIVSVLAEARRQGVPTLAITNDPASPLATTAEMRLDTGAGPERSVAATKTYTAQLAAIALLSVALGDEAERAGELARLPGWIAGALDLEASAARAAQRFREMAQCVVLGRGFNFSTASEWSLKLKELAGVVAEPYSSADFLHGPVALLKRGFPLLAVAPSGAVFDDVCATLHSLAEHRKADLVVISDRDEALELSRVPIRLGAGIPEWLSPIVAIVPAQLFCLRLAHERGLDPEAPPGLSKITRTF